jgi:putative acetyltransferase
MGNHKLPMIQINIEDPDKPETRALLDESSAYMASLYPAESNHILGIEALQQPEVTFVVARVDGQALGCGAVLKSEEHWAELKRMFVSPAARGRKLGRRLLQQLELIAAEKGATLLRLETGIKQPEALALYRSAGFVEIGPFGEYQPDPLSVFMEKPIAIEVR